MQKNKMISGDFICGICVAVFFASIFVQSLSPEEMLLFPKGLSVLGMLTGVMIVAFAGGVTCPYDQARSQNWKLALFMVAQITVAMILANFIGFFVMLYCLCLGIYVLIEKLCEEDVRGTLPKTALISLVTCGVLYLLFGILLKIPTPTGVLF